MQALEKYWLIQMSEAPHNKLTEDLQQILASDPDIREVVWQEP